MNDNDKWLILDTEPLKRLYGAVQEGDEVWCGSQWLKCNAPHDMTERSDHAYRRLRSKAWLKASEHPIQFPAWVWVDGIGTTHLDLWQAYCTDLKDKMLWQPAPQLPEPPAKEDACEAAWREWSAAHNDDIGHHAFKSGWEARGEK